MNKKTFSGHRMNTFAVTFPNGNWLSTVWGWGTYSDNYLLIPKECLKDEAMESSNVEIKFNCNEKLAKKIFKKLEHRSSGDKFDPYGHVELDEWLWVVNQLNKGENNERD
jgi:hypothetical protein